MHNLTSGQEAPMTDTRISPLRLRMIDDMTIRKMASKTQAAYIRAVKNLTVFLIVHGTRLSGQVLNRSRGSFRRDRI